MKMERIDFIKIKAQLSDAKKHKDPKDLNYVFFNALLNIMYDIDTSLAKIEETVEEIQRRMD